MLVLQYKLLVLKNDFVVGESSNLTWQFDKSEANSRISASELEIVRITKRRRLVDRLFSLGPA